MMLARLLILFALMLTVQSAGAVTIYKFTDADGVVSFSDRPTPGASVMVFRDRMVERIDGQVHLSVRREKGVHSLYVRNDLYAPVEVELKLSSVTNVLGVSGSSATLRRTIPARSNERVVVLSPKVGSKPMNYASVLTSTLGDPKGSVQAYKYPLPWIGGPFRLTQGPNGKYSHYGAKGRYAMDIAMPEGTPIIAARGGTMGVYLHLMRGSVSVREGQRVSVGTALARSGNTGNSTGPHLHFVVQRNLGHELLTNSPDQCRACPTSPSAGIDCWSDRPFLDYRAD
ncbi:Peptidase, M23/M37 family, partial [Pseudomonas savastanoi]